MTSETKIGLVVGLGFIVTFAVILSKKAAVAPYALLGDDMAVGEEGSVAVVKSSAAPPAPEPGTSSVAAGSDAMAKGAAVEPTLPDRRDAVSKDEASMVLRVNNPDAPNRSTIHAPRPGAEPNATTGSHRIGEIIVEDIRLPDVELDQDAETEGSNASGSVIVELSPPSETSASVGTNRAASATKPPVDNDARDAQTPKTEPSPSAPTRRPEPNTETKPDPRLGPKKKPTSPLPGRRPQFKDYYVRKGDTLIKIAKTIFGTSRQNLVDELYEANKDLMADRHSLKLDQKLRIPAWIPADKAEAVEAMPGASVHTRIVRPQTAPQENEPKKAPNPGGLRKVLADRAALALVPVTVGPRDEKSEAPEPAKFKPYTVKANDTFSTIAQSQMGTSKKWPELYDANKDKFPKPESLRAGAVIRIPTDSLASNRDMASDAEQ